MRTAHRAVELDVAVAGVRASRMDSEGHQHLGLFRSPSPDLDRFPEGPCVRDMMVRGQYRQHGVWIFSGNPQGRPGDRHRRISTPRLDQDPAGRKARRPAHLRRVLVTAHEPDTVTASEPPGAIHGRFEKALATDHLEKRFRVVGARRRPETLAGSPGDDDCVSGRSNSPGQLRPTLR